MLKKQIKIILINKIQKIFLTKKNSKYINENNGAKREKRTKVCDITLNTVHNSLNPHKFNSKSKTKTKNNNNTYSK